MTLVELKNSIHDRINKLDDPELLESVNILLQEEAAIYKIPQEHLDDINQGIQDIKNGDYITLDEFEKRYEKWLKD